MILNLESLQFLVISHKRMAKGSIEQETPFDVATALLVADSVRGSEHM
jgi:hypothetical protein